LSGLLLRRGTEKEGREGETPLYSEGTGWGKGRRGEKGEGGEG